MTARQLAYREYLKSEHWRNLRRGAMKRDGFKCTRCPCIYNLQVHHLLYREKFTQTILPDLVTLCEPCHTQAHGLPSLTSIKITKHEVLTKKEIIAIRKKKRLESELFGVQITSKEKKRLKLWKRRRAEIRRKNDWSF